MSDHVGRKLVLLLGLTGVALSFLLSTFAISWGSLCVLFISRAIAGFMDGSEAIAQAAIADLSIGKEKARHMAFATFAGTIGFIIGPVLGGFLAEPSFTGHFHYEIPFLVSFLLTLINVFILYWYFPKQPPTHDYSKKIGYLTILSKGFFLAFDRRIRIYSWLIFILQWSLAMFYQISTLFLVEQFHYSSSELGLFTTFLGISFSGGILFCDSCPTQPIQACTHIKSRDWVFNSFSTQRFIIKLFRAVPLDLSDPFDAWHSYDV